jgi:outer membrane protein TolC
MIALRKKGTSRIQEGFRLLVLPVVLLGGCSNYEAKPITAQGVEKQLTPPTAKDLAAQASQIHHPLLKPGKMDPRGLTPDSAAILAVILNPALRSQRDQKQVAMAQVISAGLLPNPQFSFNEDFPSGGSDMGAVHAYGLGLSWDVTALISHEAKVEAARQQQASVLLSIAWQEWQTAEAAKMAFYDLLCTREQLAVARENETALNHNLTVLQEAVDRHDKTVLDLAAAEAASLDARTAVLSAQHDERTAELALNRAIGLPPETAVVICPGVDLPGEVHLNPQPRLLKDIENRRLDLVALRRGYESQEQTLWAAVLDQFPKVNLGFNRARDNTNVESFGFGVTVDLPIFDRNQGTIAAEKATRQQLYDEYVQRIFEAHADVASACNDIEQIQQRIAANQAAIPALQKLADMSKASLAGGNIDVISYNTAVSNLASKRMDLAKLRQQLSDSRIALELATGIYDVSSIETPQMTAATQPAQSGGGDQPQ